MENKNILGIFYHGWDLLWMEFTTDILNLDKCKAKIFCF